MTQSRWRTIRAVVEVRVPENTASEKDLVWGVRGVVERNWDQILRRLQQKKNFRMGGIRIKEYSRVVGAQRRKDQET